VQVEHGPGQLLLPLRRERSLEPGGQNEQERVDLLGDDLAGCVRQLTIELELVLAGAGEREGRQEPGNPE